MKIPQEMDVCMVMKMAVMMMMMAVIIVTVVVVERVERLAAEEKEIKHVLEAETKR